MDGHTEKMKTDVSSSLQPLIKELSNITRRSTDPLVAAMMHLSSRHSQLVSLSCSMPRLCPISWATVVATWLTTPPWSWG